MSAVVECQSLVTVDAGTKTIRRVSTRVFQLHRTPATLEAVQVRSTGSILREWITSQTHYVVSARKDSVPPLWLVDAEIELDPEHILLVYLITSA